MMHEQRVGHDSNAPNESRMNSGDVLALFEYEILLSDISFDRTWAALYSLRAVEVLLHIFKK